MKTEITNHTDLNIIELENFIWVPYDYIKIYGKLVSIDYVTVPIAKYGKSVYFHDADEYDSESRAGLEYIEDTRYKETKDEELWTSDKIGEYTYCLGDEGFVSKVDFRENE